MTTRRLTAAVATVLTTIILAGCGKGDPAALIASANSYLAKNEYESAVIQLKSALQAAPDNAEARFLLGKTFLESGRPIAAETELRKALDLKYPPEEVYPLLARSLVGQNASRKLVTELGDRDLKTPAAQAAVKSAVASAYLALGDPKKANEAITAALAASPTDPHALLVQAQIVALSGDLDKALGLVDSVLAASPGNSEASVLKAQLQNTKGQRADAIATLQHAIDANPSAMNARFTLVSLLVEAGQPDQAVAQVAAMKKVAPQEFRTLYADALVSYVKGDATHAREAIQQVLATLPDNTQALFLAGMIDTSLGSYASAEDSLRKVVAQQPNQARPILALAAVYLRTGRSTQAVDLLESTLKRAPDDPLLLRAAGEAYLASGNAQRAAQYYARANAVDKTGTTASKIRLAEVRLAAGDTGQAFIDLESLSASDPKQYQADLALISAHLQRGEFDKALAAVAELEKKQPKNPLTYNIKGAAYAGMRDNAKARAAFEKALEVQPGYLPAARNLALLDIQERKPEDARRRYEEMLAKDPQNETLLLALAEVLALTNRPPDEVKAALERAIAAAPGSTRSRLALVGYYTNIGDYKSALTAAQAAQTAFPNDPTVLETLGAVQRAAGETTKAIETFKRLVQLQPQNQQAAMRLADAQAAAKDYDGAIATLRGIVSSAPDQTQAWIALAKTYYISGRPEEAISEARRLQKERPDRALGFALEGEVLAAQKKWADAATAFNDGLTRQAIPLLQARRYECLLNAGMTSQASASMAQWMKQHPKDTTMHIFLAEQSQNKKDYPDAIAHYRAALKIEPDNALLLNNLAWVLAESGDSTASQLAEQAYRQAPFNANVVDTYGWALVQNGQTAKGVELLRAASNLAPNNPEIRLHLGKALLKTGDKAGAKETLEPLKRLDNASPLRADAEKLLSGL
jgi:putative PEP-CTERM system TPR-repeat lipoprotein